ncbi:protease pro-enzyme activation domain-containing protein [Streptomyces sp. NPDC047017]|uniref:S53 family peptidase n=1 Tax=Streptomyces sp. NPDC047017 TaxID=3155024 RepID=UPI0033CED404
MGRTAREMAFRWGAAAVAALAVTATATPVSYAATADGPAPQRVGSAPKVPQGAVRAADPAADEALDLSVVLKPRDEAALNRFVAGVSDPGSPTYRHYLGTGEFATTFGALPQTVRRVRAELEAEGLTVGALEGDGLTLPVRTTVAGAAEAFATGFDGYRLGDGTTGLVNTTAPRFDGAIAGDVRTVVGLSTLAAYQPRNTGLKGGFRTQRTAPAAGGAQSRLTGTTPTMCKEVSDLYASDPPAHDKQDYWSAKSLAAQYNMADQPNVQTGTTIAVYSLENYDPKDIASYQACHRTKVPVSAVRVNGGPSQPASATTGVGVETALDVETIAGLAPQSKILVYQGPNTWQDGTDVYRRIVSDNKAKVVSVSWGSCEANTPSDVMDAENLLFQQAVAQGQTVVAASGDSGSTDCYNPNNPNVPNPTSLVTDNPAGSPYVLGVGGTSMRAAVAQQTTWAGSGGGVSQHFALTHDGDFQNRRATGYSDACAAGADRVCRQVPDVSAVADPATGYPVAFGHDSDGNQYWNILGGTSGAAPVWAALMAQADQDLACQANGTVGDVHSALYRLPATAFRDVTTGSNNLTASGNDSGLYRAGAGYDLATGLGTPNGREIVKGLCQAVPRSAASTFNALTPARVLDTRAGLGRPGTAPVAANNAVKLKVAGVGGVPADGVSAVVLNVTAAAPTSSGVLIAYPSGTTRPASSNLNWLKGQVVPNLVTVPVGADGSVDLYNSSGGTVHFIADVSGYYSTQDGGSTYLPTGPARVLDTRGAIGVPGRTAVAGHGTVSLTVAGAGGVPATGATAVVLNVTATAPAAAGFLIAYPNGASRPTTSNINWLTGQTRPNMVVLPIGADGKVNLYNGSGGSVHLIADVFGYYVPTADGSTFHTAGPSRLLDTRSALGTDRNTPVPGGATLRLDLNDGHTLAKAKAVVLNVTVTAPTSNGFLTVWPDGTTLPNASNLNWTAGQTVANLVTVPVVNGKIAFRPNAGNAHVIADLFGYYL